MNRAEFMRRLTELLADVPPAERDEAIQYYNDYFDDAGAENESSVIASLGAPEELAGAIKAGLNDGGAGGEFTETGFSGYARAHRDEIMRADERAYGGSGNGGRGIYGGSGNGGGQDTRQNNDPYSQQDAEEPQKHKMSGGSIALIVIAAILTFPIWIGVAALFGVAVSLIVTVFSLILAFFAVGLIFIIVGVALFVTGCALLVHVPLGGVCTVGVALILFGLGLLGVWLMVWCAVQAVPALFRGCAALIRKIFHRGGVAA